jgi:hypothetical protein
MMLRQSALPIRVAARSRAPFQPARAMSAGMCRWSRVLRAHALTRRWSRTCAAGGHGHDDHDDHHHAPKMRTTLPKPDPTIQKPDDIVLPTAELHHSRAGVEAKLRAEGFDAFDNSAITGPFGTMEAPVMVPSKFPSRVIGCVGT